MYRDGQLWLDLYKTVLTGAIAHANPESAVKLAKEAAMVADAAFDVMQEKRQTDGALLKLLEAVQAIGAIPHVVDRAPEFANHLRTLFVAAAAVEKGRAS